MGIRASLARALGAKAAIIPLTTSELPDKPLEKGWDDATLLSVYSDDTWPYVFANKIGEQAAQARLRAGKLSDKEEFEPVKPGHPVQELLDNPNTGQDGGEFIHLLLIYMELAGHNPIIVSRPSEGARIGAPGRAGRRVRSNFELSFLPAGPTYWKIVPGPNGIPRGYLYERDRTVVKFTTEEMAYVRWPNPTDRWYGLGRIAAARQSIMAEEYAAIRDKKFEKNLGVPPGILSSEMPLGQTQAEELQKRWERAVGGYNNAGKIAVLGSKTTYQPVVATTRDSQWLETRRHRVEEIAAAFGVPMPLVLMQDAKFANAAEARSEFWEGTLQPRLDLLARKLTRALIPLITTEPLVLRFDYSAIEALADNDLEAAQTATQWAQTGATTVDEVRKRLNLDPHPDSSIGERLIVPGTLALQSPKEVNDAAAMAQEAARAGVENTQAQAEATRNPPKPPAKSRANPRLRERSGPDAGEAALAVVVAGYERDLSTYFQAQRGALLDVTKALPTDEAENLIERAIAILTAKRFRDRLIRISRGPVETSVTLGATDAATGLGVEVSFSIPASEAALERVTTHLNRLGHGIENTTLTDVRRVITESLAAGESSPSGRLAELFDGYQDWRLDRIARTEVRAAYNLGAIGQYRDVGVSQVKVSDGDLDAPCAAANGSVWSLEEAEGNPLGHPNCRRSWIPITEGLR